MKILLISMHSIHATRWIENLKGSGHDLFWFDITNKGKLNTLENVTQFTGWKKRKLPYLKGEYWLSKAFPKIYRLLRTSLEVTENEALETIIKQIQPDLVQSFEMQTCCYPILQTMQKYPKTKWLYNCWGNDIFYYQDFEAHKPMLKGVLARIDFMTADCNRDSVLALQNGFTGKFLGVIPTGGGYDLSFYDSFSLDFETRKQIIVKGYQHIFGRGLSIVKALAGIADLLPNFEIVVFGAHKNLQDYITEHSLNFKVFGRNDLGQDEVLKEMGKSAVYIGNNISDGMPNTLLEAMLMGAFPIQSNPGGATAEIIIDDKNGFLINDPEDINTIKAIILKAIAAVDARRIAIETNRQFAKNYIDYDVNKRKILDLYQQIETEPCE